MKYSKNKVIKYSVSFLIFVAFAICIITANSLKSPFGKYEYKGLHLGKNVSITIELKISNDCSYIYKYLDAENNVIKNPDGSSEIYYYPVCTWQRTDKNYGKADDQTRLLYDVFVIKFENPKVDFKSEYNCDYIDGNLQLKKTTMIFYKVS